MKKNKKQKVIDIVLFVILIAGAVVAMFPFYWMISSALKPSNEIAKYPPDLIPKHITLEHFQYVFRTMDVPRTFLNSVIVSFVTVILNAWLSGMVAYALTKLRFPGQKILNKVVMAFMMVPFQLMVVPLFLMITKLKLLGTYSAMILPSAVSSFSIFLLVSCMVSLPDDYIQAALIDGSGHLGIYFKIIVPMTKPTLTTVILTNFFWSWNNYLWPMMVTVQNDHMATMQVAIDRYRTLNDMKWGATMAACTLTALPIVIVYLILQKQFVESVATSGIKG